MLGDDKFWREQPKRFEITINLQNAVLYVVIFLASIVGLFALFGDSTVPPEHGPIYFIPTINLKPGI